MSWHRARSPVGGSGEVVTGAAQGPREPDERQPDECRRILALDTFKQRNTQALRLEATGAVVRLLARHVAFDLPGGQGAKHDRGGVDVGKAHPGVDSQHGAGGVEACGPATQESELRAAARRTAGFAETPVTRRGTLRGTDHKR